MPEDLRSAVIVPLCKGRGERNECKNYKGIRLLRMVGKICAGILVDTDCRVTGGLIIIMRKGPLELGGGV